MTAINERFENDSDEITDAVYDLVKAAGDEIEVTYDLISICRQMDRAPVTGWLMSKFEESLGIDGHELDLLTNFFKQSPEEREEEVLAYAKEMKEKFLGNEEFVTEVHGEDEFYIQKILEHWSMAEYFSFQQDLRNEQFDIIVEAKSRLTQRLEP